MPKRKKREDDDDTEYKHIKSEEIESRDVKLEVSNASSSPRTSSRKTGAMLKDESDSSASTGRYMSTKKSTTSSRKEKPTYPLSPPNPPLPTPALDSPSLNYSYEIARGEVGVLSFEPYKSLVLPYWAFRTVPIATNSAETLFEIFQSYVRRKDLVGADMTRKYIQMGMTRAKRYANYKGGKKYGANGKKNEKWGSEKGRDGSDEDVEDVRKRNEKAEASEIFKGYWRKCIEQEDYNELKQTWTKEKKDYLKTHPQQPR